jgi:phage terminase large subunit
MMELTINGTSVFKKNLDALLNSKIRFVINQGGTRSSKTYSLCQLMIYYCLTNPNIVVSIVRKSFPALRSSVMRDLIDILKEMDIYRDNLHNKTEHIYEFPNGSMIEFFSVDNEQKLRGRKRNILWANEANELSFEEYTQLNLRTADKLYFDFNPSETFHWLYDLMRNDRAEQIHSTYKDNQFLSEDIKKQIEDLINVDEEYYKIYCLGEQAIAKSTIYSHQKLFEIYPDTIDNVVYGLDFGYNHPTALVKVSKSENKLYWEEIIYKSYLTTSDLIKLLDEGDINKNTEILCDSARPEIIEELKRAGYNAKQANKSVKEGIDSIKASELYIHSNSVNLWKEIRAYK